MKITLCSLILLFFNSILHSQNGGNAPILLSGECISDHKKNEDLIACRMNYTEWLKKHPIDNSSPRQDEKMIWPIKKSATYPGYEVYAVSNFVDHESTTSSGNNLATVKDYNCGTRTFDTDVYNHTGTDIALWPFMWDMMDNEHAEVISAKSGVILLKKDGNDDKSCAFCTDCDWNAVYILNEDNTISIYGHLKKGSLTTKAVFDSVSQGELLGIVGSSGNSTGPHLHYEVTDIDGAIIDPYLGNCNDINQDTLWESQKPYIEPTINAIRTASAPPIFSACYDGKEKISDKINFKSGDTIYFVTYYHDQTKNSVANFEVKFPNGSIFKEFFIKSPDNYLASFWYWSYILPSDSPEGVYTFSGKYLDQVIEMNFYVNLASSVAEESRNKVYYFNESLINDDPTMDFLVSIYNTQGQLILESTLKDQMSMRALPPSLYFVSLKDQHNNVSKLKIFKN